MDGWDAHDRARRAREQRIEALSVDRSQVPSAHALPPSPPESDTVESRLSELRAAVTMSERMDAWRRLVRGGQ